MALCTQCGNIINDADAIKHTCKPANIPATGKEKQPTTTQSDVV
jgi:hypothetical protein